MTLQETDQLVRPSTQELDFAGADVDFDTTYTDRTPENLTFSTLAASLDMIIDGIGEIEDFLE